MTESIGDRIKRIVKEKGHNVEWLANQLDISKQSLYKTLNKDSFNTDTLKKIADILSIPVGVFFMDEIDTAYDVLFNEAKSFGKNNIIFSGIIGKTYAVITGLRKEIEKKKLTIEQIDEALKEIETFIDEVMTIRAESILKKMTPEDKKNLMFEIDRLKSEKPNFDKMIKDALTTFDDTNPNP